MFEVKFSWFFCDFELKVDTADAILMITTFLLGVAAVEIRHPQPPRS
jgi:hypothetical protein